MAAEILQQLRSVHAKWGAASVVIADYQVAMRRCQDLEVRISQLSKENEQLRDECQDKENTISALHYQVEHARKDVEKELEAVKAEMKIAMKEKDESEKEKRSMEVERNEALYRATELEEQNARLLSQLDDAQEATSLAVSEMKESKYELNEKLKEVSQLEKEKRIREDKVMQEKEEIAKIMQDAMELEENVKRKEAEVARMHEHLERELEIQSDTTPLGFFRRKQSPFAKRLAGYARMVDKGEMRKVINAIDVLLIEMKAYIEGPSSMRGSLRGSVDEDYFLPGNDSEDISSPLSHLTIPTVAHEALMNHQGGCTCSTATYTASLVATGGADQHILLWDPSTMTVQHTLGMSEGIRDISFTLDGDILLAAGADKRIGVWKTMSGISKMVMTGHGRSVNCVVCDPTDKTRAASSAEDRRILFWDLNTGYQISNRSIKLEEWTNSICHTGGFFVSGHSKGSLKLWDTRSSEAYMEVPAVHTDGIIALVPMPISTNSILSAGKDNTIKLLDLRQTSHAVVQTFSDPHFVIGNMSYGGKGKCCIDISKDEQYISAGASSGRVMIWKANDANTRSATRLITDYHTESVIAVTWANERLFSCDRSGTIVIWT